MKFSAFVGYVHLALLTKNALLSWNSFVTRATKLAKNRHWPVVCKRFRLRTGRRSAHRPHNTIEVEYKGGHEKSIAHIFAIFLLPVLEKSAISGVRDQMKGPALLARTRSHPRSAQPYGLRLSSFSPPKILPIQFAYIVRQSPRVPKTRAITLLIFCSMSNQTWKKLQNCTLPFLAKKELEYHTANRIKVSRYFSKFLY